ncbi:hypothetical protein [Deinococcus rubellus]|uniref:Uncharacterized protein n=1 Tax=Deinococcus rubellus TaxID=1889240 RepID=A0ABY5YJP0_9DEIO|nr:hypothetical protein [Deinococcus rubellus]UWX63998.1 hypothetical protein N0D28_14965 [Deinococcus rubellus]
MHSTPSSAALMEFLVNNYGLDPALTCRLFARALNDTSYLVAAPDQPLIHLLRVYRSAWHSAVSLKV